MRIRRLAALVVLTFCGAAGLIAQDLPNLVPDPIDYKKILPLMPEAPSGWTAEQAEGTTDEAAGSKITNVHRDYHKGDGPDASITSISILDSIASPDYVTSLTDSWKQNSDTPEGYSKAITIDGNPGYESFEKDQKHGSLWVLIAKRYIVEVETQKQDSKELQEWIKKVDLKKLAEIK
jgi:hypothetical protein